MTLQQAPGAPGKDSGLAGRAGAKGGCLRLDLYRYYFFLVSTTIMIIIVITTNY